MNADPGATLRGFIDLPLRYPLEPELTGSINAFAAEARLHPVDADWIPVYARAVQVAEAALSSVDRRLEDLQRRALTIEDPSDARNRIAQVPRRDADRARIEVKAEIQRALRDWSDRLRRQHEHVGSGCGPLLRQDHLVKESPSGRDVLIALNPQWWQDFSNYVGQCCEAWSQNAIVGVDREVGSAVQRGLSPLVRRYGSLEGPPAFPAPAIDLNFDVHVDEHEVEVPGTAAHLLRAAAGFAGAVASMNPLGGLRALQAGVSFVELQRGQSMRREQAVTAWRETAVAQIRTDLERVLDRHRRALERWTTRRCEQWFVAIDRWWDARVEPHFAVADRDAVEAVRELKLQHSRIQEEISGLRSLRNQLSQTVLFDLRRRLRELSDFAAQRG